MKYEMNLKDAFQAGEERGVIKIIIGMIKAGIEYPLIMKATNYSIDKIEEIAKQHNLI